MKNLATRIEVGALCLLACFLLGGVTADANKSSNGEAEIKNQKLIQPQDMKKLEDQCLYEAGNWQDCKQNGIQRRVLKLKPNNKVSTTNSTKCDSVKIDTRTCKIVGCRYLRGEWSRECDLQTNLRFRLDRLVEKVGVAKSAASLSCKPIRIVHRKCFKTCHYRKTPWSKCSRDGFKSRKLLLIPQVNSEQEDIEKKQKVLASKDDKFKLTNAMTNKSGKTKGKCIGEKVIRRQCKLTNTNFIGRKRKFERKKESKGREKEKEKEKGKQTTIKEENKTLANNKQVEEEKKNYATSLSTGNGNGNENRNRNSFGNLKETTTTTTSKQS